MSALAVERPRSLVEELFVAPALTVASAEDRPLRRDSVVEDAAAAESGLDGGAAGDATPPEHGSGTGPVGGAPHAAPQISAPKVSAPKVSAPKVSAPKVSAPKFSALTATVPPAPAPDPRVRLLAQRPAAPAEPATGPAAQRPPTLPDRIAVLRATDRSPVLDTADEDRGPEPAADPAHVARAIAHAVVEVLLGRRPVTQLARWVTPGVYETLQGRAALTARVLGTRASGRGAAVRRVRVCTVEPHVCEAGVVVDDGVRVRAVALRLETHRGTWRTTSLEVG